MGVFKRNRLRRTWPQRLSLAASSATGVACLTLAGGLAFANHQLGRLQRVDIRQIPAVDAPVAPASTAPGQTTPTTEAPLPVIDLKAQNFLIVGSDSRGCISPDSPYYGGLYDGRDTGENSDTIMLIRADPEASQAAILSFPRDLWVKLAGSNSSGKINSVFQNANPSRLVATIKQNFQVEVDHYINVDFCAFKDIFDAVGGVSVPFAFPARDLNTGLEILEVGCHTFAGDEGLAYTRSRYYEYFDGKRWVSDGVSDFGRIARQQDFVKRAIAKAIDRGVSRPTVAQKLIDAATKRVKVDKDLTVNDMLNLAGKLRGFDPSKIRSYRIESSTNSDPLYFDVNSSYNKKILTVFRGQARLADAPLTDELPSSSSSTTSASPTTVEKPTNSSDASSTTTPPTTAVVDVKENTLGVAPTKDLTCR
jgi:LCP family protein required for cell wall assembly